MRRHLARAFVLSISYAVHRAYLAWCAADSSTTPFGRTNYKRIERFWGWQARWRQRLFIPLAKRLDRRAMVEQMVEECWWG